MNEEFPSESPSFVGQMRVFLDMEKGKVWPLAHPLLVIGTDAQRVSKGLQRGTCMERLVPEVSDMLGNII